MVAIMAPHAATVMIEAVSDDAYKMFATFDGEAAATAIDKNGESWTVPAPEL